MTVVNPKSISGINSITTGSGSDNLLTIHTSDASSTERVRINSSGDVIVGSGITVSPDGDIFATGVTTSTTFSGNFSGGTVSGTTGTFTGDVDIADKIVHTGDTDTAIRFSAADTISIETGGVTRATVSGNNIDFPDAGTLRFGASNDLQIYHGSGGASNIIHSNTSQPLIINASGAGAIRFDTDSTERLRITSAGLIGVGQATPTHMLHVDSSSASDSTATAFFKGRIIRFDGAAASNSPRLNLSLDGTDKTSILLNRTDNSLNIETLTSAPIIFDTNNTERARILAAGGLTFNGDTATANALDDYEEGNWTPTITNGFSGTPTYSQQNGTYLKIGGIVHAYFFLQFNSASTDGGSIRINSPFTMLTGNNHKGSGVVSFNNLVGSNTTHSILAYQQNSTNVQFYGGSPSAAWNATNGQSQGAKYMIGYFAVRTP